MNGRFSGVLRWVVGLWIVGGSMVSGEEVEWAGRGQYRCLVEVAPRPGLDRPQDEMVARFELDLYRLFPELPAGFRLNLDSIQIIRQDGGAAPYPKHAQQTAPGDRPYRFYDRNLMEAFPTWRRYASLEALAGRPVMEPRLILPFGHRVFQPVSEHVAGSLVWMHTQTGDEPSTYGIYFNVEPQSAPQRTASTGWIGDGSNRVVASANTAGPPGNRWANVVDWNGDGLSDLIFGVSAGYIIVAENTGDRQRPAFERHRLLYDASGQPIDVGYDACPLPVDWNGDGRRDLLVGAEKGCVLFFANEGTTAEPAFRFRGFVEADGQMLLTPNWPIAELPKGKPGEVFPADYVAAPWVCDWDADGDQDLLAGGFVTGRVFYFENVGVRDDGTPALKARGPLKADGMILDVGWSATPATVDLDSDGDLDLLCGAKPVSDTGGDASDQSANLAYFENVGSRTSPVLQRRVFPANAPPPTGTTLMAPVTDWNGDQLPDLLLVTRSSTQVFAIPNTGTATEPRFDMKQRALTSRWASQQLPPGRFLDWNRDGHPDLINRFRVMLNDGTGLPHSFSRQADILQGQGTIRHPAAHGDENSLVTLHDLDGDGDHDCIYGAHSGHIWFHENRGTDAEPSMDLAGYRLPLADGGVVRVGEPPEGERDDDRFNFTDLQGARPKPAPADIDQDGRVDLVVGDTYGRVRFFRNLGRDPSGRHQFAAPRLLFQSRARLSVQVADWTGNGKPDVFVITGQRVTLLPNLGQPGNVAFGEAQQVELPPTIGGYYGVSPLDVNGDGDLDLIYHSSARLTCYVERSFLRYGYQSASKVKAERRTSEDP